LSRERQQSLEYLSDFCVFSSPGQIEEDILQAGFSFANGTQFLHGTHGDQPAIIDDPNPVAHTFSDFEDMSGKKYRCTALSQLAENILDQAR
jgi:hypothetical protein